MNKVELLKEKAEKFRTTLKEHEATDVDAMLMLKWLTPLFDDIEYGRVSPPIYYKFRNALGKESPFYEPNSIFRKFEVAFVKALEDWPSQPGYKPPNAQ